MARNFIEKRIIKAGIDLCKTRIDQKGTMITADDIKGLSVKTFSPFLQAFYISIGAFFIVFGIWTHTELRNMAISFVPVLIGFVNVSFGLYGRPQKVSKMGSDINLMDLTAEIVQQFVAQMDAKQARKQKKAGQ